MFPVGILFCFYIISAIFAGPAETYLKKGKDYYGLFQYQQAVENLEKAVSLDASGFEAHYYLGLSLRKLNQFEKAAQVLEKAVKLGPDEDDCRKALGSIYLQFAKDQKQAGNRERMLAFLEKSCLAYPQNTPVWVSLYELWVADRRWQAIADTAKHLKQHNQTALDTGDDSNLQKAFILAAKAFIALRDHGSVRDCLTQAGRIHVPNDELVRLKSSLTQQSSQVATDLIGEGKTALEAGRYKQALELLKKAQSAEPANNEIAGLIDQAQKRQTILDFTSSADAAEKKGDWDTALAQIYRAIEFAEGDKQLEDRAASISAFIDARNEAAEKARTAAIARKQALIDQNQKLAAMLKAAEESEKKGAFEAAALSYQQALAISKGDPDITAAIERVQKAASEEKQRLEAYTTRFAEAIRKLDEGDKPDEAFALFKELADDPQNPRQDILPYLLKTSAALQNWDDTGTYLAELSSIASESDHVDYYAGLLAFQKGEFQNARKPLVALQKRNPTYAPNIGSMLWKITYEKYKPGIYLSLFFLLCWLYRPIVNFFRNVREAHIDAAIESALTRGKYAELIPLLETRLADSGYTKNRKQLTVSLADAYLRQGRPADASTQAAIVVAKDPKNPNAQRILGEATFQLGDRSAEGLERIMALYRLDENRKDVLAFLATQYRAGKHESKAAFEILTRQFQLAPDDRETLFYLADMYEKRQNFSAASIKVFERAIRFFPDKVQYHASLASCLMQTGRQDEAARVIAKALEKWPNHPDLTRLSPSGPGPRSEEFPASNSSSRIGVISPTAGVPSGEQVPCPHCGKSNPPREYYCGSCGKPIR
ncbi:tetratricopeptide repeat protein [Candidatus Ozemobacteraceae bacterium]|nr:tetratricopeptide repeat protein [Candidatus Ozemobacteraceae bacterium]